MTKLIKEFRIRTGGKKGEVQYIVRKRENV